MWKALYLRHWWPGRWATNLTYRQLYLTFSGHTKFAYPECAPWVTHHVPNVKNLCALGMSRGEMWDLVHCRRLGAEQQAVRVHAKMLFEGGDLLVEANWVAQKGGRPALWRAAVSACQAPVADGATDVHVRLPTLECLVIGFLSGGARDDFVERFSALRAGGTQHRDGSIRLGPIVKYP